MKKLCVMSMLCVALGFPILSYAAVGTRTSSSDCKVNDPDIATTYKGSCQNGLANGVGIATGVDTYTGTFKNGDMSGQGLYVWKDGSRYDGQWLKNNMEGMGTYSWPSGSVYNGSYKNGNRNGQGTMNFADGYSVKGEWKENQIEDPIVTIQNFTKAKKAYISYIDSGKTFKVSKSSIDSRKAVFNKLPEVCQKNIMELYFFRKNYSSDNEELWYEVITTKITLLYTEFAKAYEAYNEFIHPNNTKNLDRSMTFRNEAGFDSYLIDLKYDFQFYTKFINRAKLSEAYISANTLVSHIYHQEEYNKDGHDKERIDSYFKKMDTLLPLAFKGTNN